MIRQITEFWMRLRGATKIDVEIYRIRRNMEKDEARLIEMDEIWRYEGSPCCPFCRFSPIYGDLEAKQDRRREMIKALEKRKKSQNNF